MIQIRRKVNGTETVIYTLGDNPSTQEVESYIDILDGSIVRRELMGEHYARIRFSLATPIYLRTGDYIDLTSMGYCRFELTSPYVPKYNPDNAGFDFDITFDAYYKKWANKICLFRPDSDVKETEFDLTAKLETHLEVILANINYWGSVDSSFKYNGTDFNSTIQEGIGDEMMHYKYQNVSIEAALTALAGLYDCEWWVDGGTIYFGKYEHGSPVTFQIGIDDTDNVVSMDSSDTGKGYANRLYVFGSTRNIPTNYREVEGDTTLNAVAQKRLMLPESTCPNGYIQEVVENESQIVEDVLIIDNIYPKCTLIVSNVATYTTGTGEEERTYYRVSYTLENGNPFVFSEDYRLDGENLMVHMESGNMNGMDFEVIFNPTHATPEYTESGNVKTPNPAAQVFELVVNEEYGTELPNDTLHPVVGDTFVLYGWDSTKIASLGLVAEAEQELYTEGVTELAKSKVDSRTYTCTMWADEYSTEYDTGQRITLVNPAFEETNHIRTGFRITGYEKKLDIPYDQPKYIIGKRAFKKKKLSDMIAELNLGGIGTVEKNTYVDTEKVYRDCGEWVDGSQVANPSPGYGIYFVDEYDPTSMRVVTHDVWHNGAKWRCMQHQPVIVNGVETYYEPEDGSEYWNKIESMPALAVLEMDTNVVLVETDSDGYVTTAVNKSVGIRILLGNDILSATNIEITEDGSVNYVILDDPTIYSTDENDYVEAEVEYLDGGASVVAETLYLDGRYYLVIHGVRVVIQRGALLDKHNATLDITCEDSSGKSYSLRGTLQIAGVSDGVDGTSTPVYFDEWFAWSNVESTADVYTSPFVEPYVGWSLSIPNNNGLAYLWRKQIRHEYNAASHTYTTENAQYVRMNGTNGTSIHTRGQVASANKRGAGTAYILVEGGSEERITLSDGDAVTQLDNGHLYQWVTEGGGQWLDLGQFKGEAGVTYYTHVAWATDVTYSGSTITSVSGFIITKSADDTTHHWMGILVDTNSGQDPANATLYTWSYIKGENGVNAIHLTIDNEHEDFIYSAGEKVAPTSVTIQAHLYDGNSEIDATDVRWTINLNKTTGIDLSLLTNDYGRYTLSGINANTANLCIQATYPIVGGRTYEAIFTSNRTSQDKYDIIASPSSIAYNPASYQTQTITLSAVKTNLAGVQSYATISTMSGNPSAGDLRVLYAFVNSDGTKTAFTRLAATSIGITAENCRDYVGIYFELHLFTSSTNSVVKDYETVEFAKSENGTDGVGGLSIGATPSNIFVNTDASGKAEASSQDIRVEVFEGDTKVPVAQYTISHGTLPSGITWTGRYHDAFTIAVAANTMLTTPVVIPFTVALSSGGSINSSIIVIPNKRGVDGSAYYLDLTNENDSLQYMGDENLTGTVTSQAILYNGNTPVQSDVEFFRDASSTITAGYCTVNDTTGAITVTGLPDGVLSGVLVIKATYNNSEDYYKTFSVQRIDNGEPKYELLIDKASVVQNTSESTASQTVNVKVFKTAIDTTSKKLVKRQLTTLLTDHLRLYAVPSSGATGDMTRNYGLDGLNYQASALNITSVTFHVTNDYEWGRPGIVSYDYETIPVVAVQNGQTGQTGKMGRTPYYWGKWSEKSSTAVFSVTDYMTPYVAYDAGGGSGSVPQCWIFIGENGNYTKVTAGAPSNLNQKWQLMTTDFEYLITKAIFSDFAKLGSAIFNGDYMFSQWGTDANGASSHDYEYFDPTGATNRFTPNIRMNWMTGEIYSQLGHFVNVTVEGVLNNLVQVITDDNYQNYGTYNSNWSDESEVYGATFFLNPLKVDGFVKIVKSCNIHFPSACCCLDGGNDNYIDKIFDGEDSGNHLTYEEMRQCIGKKIILLPNMPQDGASLQSQYRFMCGGTNAGYANKLLVTKSILFPVSDAGTMSSDLTAIATDGNVSEPTISYSRYMYIHPNYGTNTRFYVFECKLGHYNTKECIYWEMQEIGSILNAQ